MAPWINSNIQSKISWRDDDVVISVPGKSGTTWTMNIVYQLREHGNRNFEDIYSEITWIETMRNPSSTEEDMVAKIDGIPKDRPRAFKSHASPPTLPYRENVKYVVVARNPEESLVSMRVFLTMHSEALFKHWGADKNKFTFPNFQSYYEGFAKGSFVDHIFEFVSHLWELRNKPNVLMIHYTDMVQDHEKYVKKISDFLGYGPYTKEEWQTILELTSFSWMKKHEIKFEGTTIWEVPALDRGGMMRQGSFGLARKEGMTEDIAMEVREHGKEILKDDDAFNWLYNGGEII